MLLIKNAILIFVITSLFFMTPLMAQTDMDSTGFAGDNFSLQGALELFKQSKSLEEFEEKLNKEESNVNNLDLNEDGDIDYIRVVDNMEGDVHAVVLQVPVSEDEFQDIAVIAIEKVGDKNAMLQIIGDEDVYGEEVIVEPGAGEEITPAPGKGGMPANYSPARIVINVWAWGGVRHIYRPNYRVWHSPWNWGYYPKYWKPSIPHRRSTAP